MRRYVAAYFNWWILALYVTVFFFIRLLSQVVQSRDRIRRFWSQNRYQKERGWHKSWTTRLVTRNLKQVLLLSVSWLFSSTTENCGWRGYKDFCISNCLHSLCNHFTPETDCLHSITLRQYPTAQMLQWWPFG